MNIKYRKIRNGYTATATVNDNGRIVQYVKTIYNDTYAERTIIEYEDRRALHYLMAVLLAKKVKDYKSTAMQMMQENHKWYQIAFKNANPVD